MLQSTLHLSSLSKIYLETDEFRPKRSCRSENEPKTLKINFQSIIYDDYGNSYKECTSYKYIS